MQLLSHESNFDNHRHQRVTRDDVRYLNTGTYRATLADRRRADLHEGWLSQKDNICVYDQ